MYIYKKLKQLNWKNFEHEKITKLKQQLLSPPVTTPTNKPTYTSDIKPNFNEYVSTLK